MPRPSAIPDSPWRTILKRLAETGEPRAQYEYYLVLPWGETGSPERAEGWRWLERAARSLPAAQESAASRTRGQPNLLSMFDERRARLWERHAAESGLPSAQRKVAWWWLSGPGPRHTDGPGARRLRAAVRAGDGYAAHDLALCVETFAGDLARVERWLERAVLLDEDESDSLWPLEFLRRAKPWLARLRTHPAETWRSRAEAGEPLAQTYLGYAYRFGRGAPYAPKSAQTWFRRAASQGGGEAALALGLSVYDHEMDVSLGETAEWFERAASRGDATAHWGAGYFEAYRDHPNLRRGGRHLRVAADLGHARAAFELARCYFWGDGARASAREAARWMRRAAEGGVLEAQAWLAEMLTEGDGVRRDARQATKWLRRAAEGGNTDAMLKLGVRLHEGQGTRRDDVECVRWYRRAAARGERHATANLGLCFKHGHGVRKDARLALRWFRRAAWVLDHPRAALHLGNAYRDGWTGRKDPVRAARWFTHGAVQREPECLRRLGIAYHEGWGVPQDHALAALLYRAAAARGDSRATYCLGLCYRDGEGVPKSRTQARRWFRRAAGLGVREAGNALRAPSRRRRTRT